MSREMDTQTDDGQMLSLNRRTVVTAYAVSMFCPSVCVTLPHPPRVCTLREAANAVNIG